MSITVGDVLRIVVTMVWLDGDLAQNIFNAVIAGTGGPFDDGDIVDDAVDWAQTMFANLTTFQSDEIDGSQVQVYIYDPVDDDWDEVGSASFPYNPTGAADQMPRGVAGLINAKTLDPDVSGKKYVAALMENNADHGLWSAGLITGLANFAADWTGLFTGGTSGASWVPGVWSQKQTNLRAMTGDVIIPSIPAYQRRRKQGVGV